MSSDRALNAELASRFAKWLVVQRYAAHTRDAYGRALKRYLDWLHKSILKTTHLDVQNYLADRAAAGESPKNVRNQLYALRVFFDFLNLGGLIKWVPPRVVRLRPMQRHIPTVLTNSQVRKLLSAARTRHERALVEVLYGTGCRTGELCSMRVEKIDFEERRMRVQGKGGDRLLMFTQSAARALRRYIGARRAGYVFVDQRPPQRIRPQFTKHGQWQCHWKVYDEAGRHVMTKSGFVPAREKLSYREAVHRFSGLARHDCLLRPLGLRPLSNATVETSVHKIGLRVGLKVNPYSFRHTFATHLLDNGADIRIVQDLLGHASIRSTQVYLHISKKHVQRIFDQCHPR